MEMTNSGVDWPSPQPLSQAWERGFSAPLPPILGEGVGGWGRLFSSWERFVQTKTSNACIKFPMKLAYTMLRLPYDIPQ